MLKIKKLLQKIKWKQYYMIILKTIKTILFKKYLKIRNLFKIIKDKKVIIK